MKRNSQTEKCDFKRLIRVSKLFMNVKFSQREANYHKNHTKTLPAALWWLEFIVQINIWISHWSFDSSVPIVGNCIDKTWNVSLHGGACIVFLSVNRTSSEKDIKCIWHLISRSHDFHTLIHHIHLTCQNTCQSCKWLMRNICKLFMLDRLPPFLMGDISSNKSRLWM